MSATATDDERKGRPARRVPARCARSPRSCRAAVGRTRRSQSMPDVSPTKWHRAHTTWFFETFVLERVRTPTCRRSTPTYRFLFNSYYEAVGPRVPRGRSAA